MTPTQLAEWVRARGLTQAEAATLLGLTRNGLQRQLYGERPVSRQTERIVELLTSASRTAGTTCSG